MYSNFIQIKSSFLENISIIVRAIQIYANNIVFPLKIKVFCIKLAINYSLPPFFMLLFHLYKIIFFTFCVFLFIYLLTLFNIDYKTLAAMY